MSYFKPWRRKIGVLLLVVTCVFMAGWVRSVYFSEAFHFKTGRLSWVCFCLDQTIFCGIALDNWQPFPSAWLPLPYRSLDDFNKSMLEPETYREVSGFGTALLIGNKGGQFRLLILPCQQLVVALTLLSAYLLLSKPRAKARPTQIESGPGKQ